MMTSVSKKVISPVVDLTEDDDAWAAMDEVLDPPVEKDGEGDGNKAEVRPKWMPEGLDPVLEELPKWNLLSEILLEVEGEIIRQENQKKSGTTGTCVFSSPPMYDESVACYSLWFIQYSPRNDFLNPHLQPCYRIHIEYG